MDIKRTMTMNWDGLGCHDDEDDDDFFDANNRISTVVPMDLLMRHSDDDSDDDDFEDPRMSFASVISSSSEGGLQHTNNVVLPPTPPLPLPSTEEYDIWMAAPTSIQERRRRLLQGMGLNSSKELLKLRTMVMSKKFLAVETPPLPHDDSKKGEDKDTSPLMTNSSSDQNHSHEDHSTASIPPDASVILVRSRSDGDIDPFSFETKRRKELLIGSISKQRITRTLSTYVPFSRLCKLNYNTNDTASTSTSTSVATTHQSNDHEIKKSSTENTKKARPKSRMLTNSGEQLGAFFLIKNLDTGKEFVVKEFAEDGMWNRLSDLQTGRQLTMEEFEKSVGYSPVVKELMRRENRRRNNDVDSNEAGLERKSSVNAYLSKSFRYSKKRGVSLLKNINKVANSVTGLGAVAPEKEQHLPPPIPVPTPTTPPEPQKGVKNGTQNSEWVRVRSQGKAYKELTALRFCQEIQAHQGSIWTIKFNFDGRYLASAGEDKVIHVWEVQKCEIASLKPPEESANSTPVHPVFCPSPDRAPDMSTLEKKKKGRSGSRRGSNMPDYVQLPETVFALSNEPVCSFKGHLDDVLDLSWSSSQFLLSSSMDKTVRLWDLEKKVCLKLFAHNDYVTCIQFNPVNDEYFISGSLDAKVRIWNVPGRRVVDWTDLHEMVTAACYTPDGQGAAVGSHKGNCRMYNISEGKLNPTIQFDIHNKKKTPKKITGFEFASDNPNEVLVTSADSRIRIFDGSESIQKFRGGFRNTSSQIAASFSPDEKYVICGSEDSNVYVWKREEPRSGKTKNVIDTSSYEYFQCKDVSVAIPWPGGIKIEPPTIQLNSKKNSKKPQASATSSPKKEDVNKNKKQLPPLPTNKKNSNTAEKTVNNDNCNNNTSSCINNESINNSNINKDEYENNSNNNNTIINSNNNNNNSSNNINNSNNNNSNNNSSNSENSLDGEKPPYSPEADPAQIARTESGVDSSFNSCSGGSIRYSDSPSNLGSSSPSWAPGWSWFDGGGSHGSETMQARAWGLVIVTAGLGGEIRAYQNFGVPLKVGRQSNIFITKGE
ncbi:WD repeat-containing protein 44-like [Chenopodium quinoa]|uniref:WD repeat-containing protein 44-like n=1 Tax=Chenopodium quinoa TaxID=63459 RepID=UPI000B77546E|nr:WD repeat-containing protein 44-like [Chenopodium quinoa]